MSESLSRRAVLEEQEEVTRAEGKGEAKVNISLILHGATDRFAMGFFLTQRRLNSEEEPQDLAFKRTKQERRLI